MQIDRAAKALEGETPASTYEFFYKFIYLQFVKLAMDKRNFLLKYYGRTVKSATRKMRERIAEEWHMHLGSHNYPQNDENATCKLAARDMKLDKSMQSTMNTLFNLKIKILRQNLLDECNVKDIAEVPFDFMQDFIAETVEYLDQSDSARNSRMYYCG